MNLEIRTFAASDLVGAKKALESAFRRAGSDEVFNEWEFAERLLRSDGYVPELCLVACDGETVAGYNALTRAKIGGAPGLALGPLGVRKEAQGRGIGSALVRESVQRAKDEGFPWIALLGGDFYARFGFEPATRHRVTVSDDAFENAHAKILFLDEAARGKISGRLAYCDAFYDAQGRLL